MPIRSSISTTCTRPSLVSLLLSGRQRTTTFTHSLGAMLLAHRIRGRANANGQVFRGWTTPSTNAHSYDPVGATPRWRDAGPLTPNTNARCAAMILLFFSFFNERRSASLREEREKTREEKPSTGPSHVVPTVRRWLWAVAVAVAVGGSPVIIPKSHRPSPKSSPLG